MWFFDHVTKFAYVEMILTSQICIQEEINNRRKSKHYLLLFDPENFLLSFGIKIVRIKTIFVSSGFAL
jgi:hypothetical protein